MDTKKKRISPKRGKKSAKCVYDKAPENSGSTTVILEGVKKAGSRQGKNLKTSGMSIGIKFALMMSIVAALLCLCAQLFVYFQIKKSLLTEIDRKGCALVKSVAGLADAYYKAYSRILDDFEKNEKKIKEEEKEENKREKKINTLKNSCAKDCNALMATYKDSLNRIIKFEIDGKICNSEEILNVIIKIKNSSRNIPPVLTKGSKETNIEGAPRILYERLNNTQYPTSIQVIEGEMATDSGVSKIRSYRMPVFMSSSQKAEMEAVVVLSEKEITRSLNRALFGILITAFIAILIAIGFSFFLADKVTRPIRNLIEDVEIVSEGDLKHTTQSTSRDEIGVLARTFNVMTKNLFLAHQSELEQKAREHELKIATEIQSNLLPSQIPQIAGYDIAAFYDPSKEVGGDYYDFIKIDDNYIGFIIADVSGKSIPGSMVMTMTRAMIRMEALRNLSPAKMFTEVNKILAQDIARGMFVTAMYGVLSISTGEIWISSAGHNPAILADGKHKHILINPKGMALGLDKGTIFEKTVKEQKFQIKPGQMVVFYTDGVPEAMSLSNEEFGDDKFYQLIEKEAGQTCDHVVQTVVKALEKWRGNGPQSDDITILAFKKA